MEKYAPVQNEASRTWQLPVLGKPASEQPPTWIVERIASGYFTVNSLGGFTVKSEDFRSCVAGQSVELEIDGRVVFHH